MLDYAPRTVSDLSRFSSWPDDDSTCDIQLIMEMQQMAERKKTSSKGLESDAPVSSISKEPATTTAAAEPAKKKAVTRKAAASKKKTAAGKKASTTAKRKTTSRKTASNQTGTSSNSGNGTKPVISQRQRQQMIGDAAYLISLKRDPWQGSPHSDWVAAETVIDMFFDVTD